MVYCAKKELERFKRRAIIAYPNEYMEVLLGHRSGHDYYIHSFFLVSQKANRTTVWSPSIELYEAEVAYAERKTGWEYLGSIHTHTDAGADVGFPSATDNDGSIELDEEIFAIDFVARKNNRFSHTVNFWYPQEPIEEVHLF
jgi:proteasome lid subunit RPN8/RPN11